MDKLHKHLKEAWKRLSEEHIKHNSNGEQIADNTEVLKSFWSWFGNSVMVDRRGNPLVCYHTTSSEFDEFDVGRGSGVAGTGIYLTTMQFSDDRYGDRHLELYVRCENPLDLSDGDKMINEHAKKMGLVGLFELSTIPQMRQWSKDFREGMLKMGYDGCFVMPQGGRTGERHLVVYNKNQVKLVGNNNYTNSNKIREAWKRLSEYIEPKYPSGVKSTSFKKAGVQGSERKVNQYQFKTTSGNDVKVHIKREVEDGLQVGNVIFYVNDTLDDKSSTSSGVDTDVEILNGVLGIMKKAVDRLKLDKVTFEAWRGEGDTKRVKGLRVEGYIESFRERVGEFKRKIEKVEPERLEPTSHDREFAKKFNREVRVKWEFNKEAVLGLLEKLEEYLSLFNTMAPSGGNGKYVMSSIKGMWESFDLWLRSGSNRAGLEKYVELGEFLASFKDIVKRVMSNTGEGHIKQRNRRKSLYKKLVGRYFGDWSVDVWGDSFELTRGDR